jgi:hypothetical protein
MTKFNKPTTAAAKTENLAGGEAFSLSPKMELATFLLTSFVQDKFYEKEAASLVRIRKMLRRDIRTSWLTFAAKAAIYARHEFGMRSISHLTAAEIAAISRDVPGVVPLRTFFRKVCRIPKDTTEIVSYFLNRFGKPIPNGMKRGIGDFIVGCDRYQLAKYRAEDKKVSLVDVVNLCHPKPKDEEMAGTLKMLVSGDLKSKATWESKLTKAGQEAKSEDEKKELKQKSWADLISTKKIGQMALLRNLRNIAEQAPDMVTSACRLLVDPHRVKSSMIFPFRYMTAMDNMAEGEYRRDLLAALNEAATVACDNCPKLDGTTLIAVDDSGSMHGRPFQGAAVFASVLYKVLESDLLMFNTHGRMLSNILPHDSVLGIAHQLVQKAEWGGTDFKEIFRPLKRTYDRIIILSDSQHWVGHYGPGKQFNSYQRATSSNPFLYMFDMSGYGTVQFPENRVHILAGYSDKIFDVMKLLEKDRNALIEEIEKIEL